jgi:ATP-dependent Clp protease adapter protein ClpS
MLIEACASPGWHCHPHRKETKKKKPPQYRVMLHNDSFNRREYVVKILLKVVDVITMADAVNIMQVNLNCCAAHFPYVAISMPSLAAFYLMHVSIFGAFKNIPNSCCLDMHRRAPHVVTAMKDRRPACLQKAHVDGLACVVSCPQEDAESYCEGLRGNGLISSVEPDS